MPRSKSLVTWATSVPILVFLGLSVLDLGQMYVTDRQTSDAHNHLMPPNLGAGGIIIQARRLTLFGHIARMDDNIDAKQILTSSPSVYWKRPLGRPRITWMKTVQNDLNSHGLSWTDAVDLAQNRVLVTSGATHL